jgi:transportin-1
LLKNNIKNDFNDRISGKALEHIQMCVLQCLTDSNDTVRHTAGSFISDFFSMKGLEKWPNLLPSLIQVLGSSQSLTAQEGVMSALLKICEDSNGELEKEKYGRPLNTLVPIFIKFLEHPDEIIRKHAFSCILVFLDSRDEEVPNAIIVNMDSLLQRIFKLALDKSLSIRRRVCAAFTYLLKIPEYLDKDMKSIFEYILVCSTEKDEQLCLEATEFWSHLTESDYFDNYAKLLANYLPKFFFLFLTQRLIPILISNMVFSEMDRVTYEEDSQKPDRDQDINPKNFFSHPKNHSGHQSIVSINDSDSEGDDEENDQWDDSGDDWTLRKSSSLTLDNIANYYKDAILELTLPVIQQKMDMKQEWYIRESSILALGAISEGCRSGMEKYLPELIPYLLTVLNDPKPLVRCITCWTIGRYSAWIVAQKSSNIFQGVLKGILERMMDSNKKVQESSCSTFIGLIEMGRKEIYPFIFPCLQAISKSFSYYSVSFPLLTFLEKEYFEFVRFIDDSL